MKFSITYNTHNALVGLSIGDRVLQFDEESRIGKLVGNWISLSILGIRFSLYSEEK